MKKLIYTAAIAAIIFASACKGPSRTGNAAADSGSAGSSGAADTNVASGAGTGTPVTNGGTDTSTLGKGATAPTVDSTSNKKP